MTVDEGRKPDGAPECSAKAGEGAPSGVDANGPKRFSVQRKMSVVSRLLRRRATQERSAWSTRSRRALRTGAFLSCERAPGELSRGELPPENYFPLVRGTVASDGIVINL